ncbi:uncharacterized protein LOC126811322 [Patella vulgata]|uniref:uncharacterized protein LOC126811322 n=1 Tax=Patella vulgata TaxID=6465 RepID=UPI0024A9F6E4|nr:uncharacterized protein LOC126811322 [Patella vulgata]
MLYVLGPSSESWFDDISKEKIDKKDNVSNKLYGKVTIETDGFPRVLFSPGPTHIDNDELGFHLNSTVEEDRTLLRSSQPCVSINSNHDVKRASQETIREFSQETIREFSQEKQKSKTSPPTTGGHPDELFSQISPSSLHAMCVSPKDSTNEASCINVEELNVKKEDMSVEKSTVDEKEFSKTSGPSISECDSKNNECGGQKEKISKFSIKSKARRFLYPSLNQITKSSPQNVYGFDTKSKGVTDEVKIKTDKNDRKLEDKKETIQSSLLKPSSLEMKLETVSSTDIVKFSDIKAAGNEV